MPELAEVEKAAEVIRLIGKGRKITRVDTVDDAIVFAGVTPTEFANEVTGRTLLDTVQGRYGKLFYLTLDGEGRMPVLHLGMTGMLHVRGGEAVYYRKKPKNEAEWPPRFMRFILHFEGTNDQPADEIAFLDPRRLGRVRLCKNPLKEPPISTLGFDPILCMPTLEEFQTKIAKRGCPIKALLLDQSFSAGVGNWIADEVLFHAAIHPEQVAKTLSKEQMKALHRNILYVCETAVNAKADASLFPSHWLFPHRWGKGKAKSTLVLPSGEKASIKWITVGGRTSAVVQQVQKLDKAGSSKRKKVKKADTDDSDLTEPSSSEENEKIAIKTKAGSKRKRKEPSSVTNAENKPVARKRLKHSGLSQTVETFKITEQDE